MPCADWHGMLALYRDRRADGAQDLSRTYRCREPSHTPGGGGAQLRPWQNPHWRSGGSLNRPYCPHPPAKCLLRGEQPRRKAKFLSWLPFWLLAKGLKNRSQVLSFPMFLVFCSPHSPFMSHFPCNSACCYGRLSDSLYYWACSKWTSWPCDFIGTSPPPFLNRVAENGEQGCSAAFQRCPGFCWTRTAA